MLYDYLLNTDMKEVLYLSSIPGFAIIMKTQNTIIGELKINKLVSNEYKQMCICCTAILEAREENVYFSNITII